MDRLFQWYKYLKYILLPIIILKYLQVEGVQNGHPLIILEYALLFGVSFLLIILQDFFAISKNKIPTATHHTDYFTVFGYNCHCLSSDNVFYFFNPTIRRVRYDTLFSKKR